MSKKSLVIRGDNVDDYAELAIRAVKSYRKATGFTVDEVSIRDANGELSFLLFSGGVEVGQYYLESSRVKKAWIEKARVGGIARAHIRQFNKFL